MQDITENRIIGKLCREAGCCFADRRAAFLTAFLFPVLVCCAGFALTGVWPFGRNSALVIDGVHQYLGFYEELQTQLGKGLGWTFSGHAMGYNFFSLFSYYLCSPFNLLVLLLMQFLYVNEAVTIAVLLKIGLTGVCMAWYVEKKYPGKLHIAVCAGCMYALSNYILGYYSNLMWLDCVMIVPLLVWSLEELVRNGRWKMYTAVLAYGILTNYYMGFMLCVFSVLYFLAVWIGADHMKVIRSGIRFAGASFLAGGLAGIILLPAVSAVAGTPAAKQAGLPTGTDVYGSLWEQLNRMLLDSFPYATSGDQSSVNLYCGCAAIFFVVLFFLNREIRWRRKLAAGGLLVFYFAGFHIPVLNLLLHGLHRPVGLPNRFAFLFIFLLIRAGAEGWAETEQMGRKAFAVGTATAILFCAVIGVWTGNLKVLGSAGLILLYFSLLAEVTGFYRVNGSEDPEKPKICGSDSLRKNWTVLLCLFLLAEIGLHGIASICNTGSAGRTRYVESGEELKQVMAMKSDRDSYRADIVNPILRNEELLFGLNGVSMFSSTNTAAMQTWMEKMGFETGANRFQYNGSTEVMDMLLGVKYVACRNNIGMDTPYARTYHGRHFDLYENVRALPAAYLVDDGIRDFSLNGRNPFEVQNELLGSMGYGNVFQMQDVAAPEFQPKAIETAFEIPLKGGEHGYLWISGTEPSTVNVDGRMQQYDDWNNRLLDLGYSRQDRIVSVKVTKHITKALLGTVTQEKLDQIYRNLSQNTLQMQDRTGQIRADRDGVLFFPCFYDRGIRILVDGRPADTLDLKGMLGVPVTAGTHRVVFAYEVPGLKTGAACSAVCLAVLLILPGKRRKQIQKKKESGGEVK